MGFFGVLIGITLTELIKGVAETIRNKKRIKYYIPHGILVGLIFMVILQSFFDFQWFSKGINIWTPILLIRFTLPWILICLSSYLVFPSFEGHDFINFKDNFDRIVSAGMRLMIGLIPLNISFNIFYTGQSIFHFENLILLTFLSLNIATMVFKKDWLRISFLCLATCYELYKIITY